jgi:hypothetical protein
MKHFTYNDVWEERVTGKTIERGTVARKVERNDGRQFLDLRFGFMNKTGARKHAKEGLMLSPVQVTRLALSIERFLDELPMPKAYLR